MSTARGSFGRLAVAAIAGIAGAAPPISAQGTFQVRPSISVSQVYESNLFSTASDRQEDFITRFTPGIEADYRSSLWTVSSRYALDVERFADHADLTSADARQHGALTAGYRPTPRLTIGGGAEYLTTRTPAELNVGTGLAFTRARAERFTVRSSVAQQPDPVTAATIEYAFTTDRLGSLYEADMHTAVAGIERRTSARTTVTGRYRARAVAFTGAGAARSTVTSHSAGLGVRRLLTPHLSVSIEAGPRLTGDVIRPEVSASIDWKREPFELSLGYGRTQSTAVGLVAPIDTQTLRASLSRTFWRSLEVRVSPAVFRSLIEDLRADVYVLAAGVTQHFSNAFALELVFDGVLQHGALVPAAIDREIPRHAILMRFVAAGAGRQQGRW